MEPLTGYRVEISKVPFTSTNASGSSSSCQVYVVGDVASCSFKVAANTTYYCRVRAYGDTGSSTWSETTFKTHGASSASVAEGATSRRQALPYSEPDVVSEAFADLFVEEDEEDDFWFEFDKALGKER